MKYHKASFTIEASIYVPVMVFMMMWVLHTGVEFFLESRERGVNPTLQELDIVQEFYMYQGLGELGEEIFGD